MGFDKIKVQQIFPEATMYEPMLINKGTDTLLKVACSDGNHFGQLKKDGFLYIYEKHQNHSYLFSRTVSRENALLTEKGNRVPHIMKALNNTLPPETILLGEVYYPRKTSKDVTTILGCLPAKAIERQEGTYGWIHYYVYDILMYNGVDFVSTQVGNFQRYQVLQKIWEKHGLKQYDFLELAQSWEDMLYERIGIALAQGEEGMVIKQKDAPYVPGKRPMTNLKAKKVDFLDAVIIGFEEPTKEYYGKEIENWQYWISKDFGTPLSVGLHYGETDAVGVTKAYYLGWMNARMKIGAYDNKGNLIPIGTIHSGINDEMKQDMSEHPEKYLNKVCKIQAMELDKAAKTIRHGFYIELHKEKNANECKIDEIFGQSGKFDF